MFETGFTGRSDFKEQGQMPENRFFEDIARVANGAFGAMAGVRSEMEAMVRQRMERLTAELNLITRDEFDAVRELAANARSAQEALEARILVLEAKIAALTPVAPVAPAKPRATAAKRPKKAAKPAAE
jgi:BMFP domain-containing protein YqiC